MRSSIKLNPIRLIVPKYNNSPMLFLESIAGTSIMPLSIINNDEYFEIELPLTKHSVRRFKEYINANLDINE